MTHRTWIRSRREKSFGNAFWCYLMKEFCILPNQGLTKSWPMPALVNVLIKRVRLASVRTRITRRALEQIHDFERWRSTHTQGRRNKFWGGGGGGSDRFFPRFCWEKKVFCAVFFKVGGGGAEALPAPSPLLAPMLTRVLANVFLCKFTRKQHYKYSLWYSSSVFVKRVST